MATATEHQTLDPAEPAHEPVRVLALRSVDGHGGGAEAILLRTAARIDPRRVRLAMCCIRRADDQAYDFDRRAAALGLDYCEVVQQSILARGVVAALRRFVAQRQIQVVDAQDYKAAFFAFQLARLEGIVPVATLHGWSGHSVRERLVYYPAERLLTATFPLAVAVSGEMRDALVRWGSRRQRVHVLPNGIDAAEFRRATAAALRIRSELGIAPGQVVVGAVGRLECEKRFDVLLDAMGALLRRRGELRLIIVGEGSRRAALERQIRRLGIAAQCRLLGHRSDVRDVYQAMDLFVQSSDHEGSPTVIVEAMAMEIPVVATAVGGTCELIEHGIHGLLVPRRDPQAMARAIEQTVDDPQAAGRRVAAARSRTETELSFDSRTRKLETLYAELQQASS